MGKIPHHLGIILDGNRRWAKERGLSSFEGHRKGLEKITDVVKWCRKRDIKILTLFVFSTENWNRSKEEVDYLMQLANRAVRNSSKDVSEQGIKVRVIGDKGKLPPFVLRTIEEVEDETKDNKEMTLNFALSYGGRSEIVQAVKKIVASGIAADQVTESLVSENLWTTDLDLIIRTGKEKRISNFLIWQAAYSELFFYEKYWPDFTESDLQAALEDYANRKRRFGK
jgi:undecaprenyl diphosphate synthase